MERVPIDVWESNIFIYLDDIDIIVINSLSKSIRNNLNKDGIYTRRFRNEWLVFDDVSPFDIDITCITRIDYIRICKNYKVWEKDVGLKDAFNITLRKKWCNEFELTFNSKNDNCSSCGKNCNLRKINVDLPTIFPRQFYENLYDSWLIASNYRSGYIPYNFHNNTDIPFKDVINPTIVFTGKKRYKNINYKASDDFDGDEMNYTINLKGSKIEKKYLGYQHQKKIITWKSQKRQQKNYRNTRQKYGNTRRNNNYAQTRNK